MKDLWYGEPSGLQVSERGKVRWRGALVDVIVGEVVVGGKRINVSDELRRLRREKCLSVGSERKKAAEVYEYDPLTFEVLRKWGSTLEAARDLKVKHSNFARKISRGCVSRGRLFLDRVDAEAARAAFEWNRRWSASGVEMYDTFTNELLGTYDSVTKAAKATGFSPTLISLQINGKYTSNCEYTFRRAYDQ